MNSHFSFRGFKISVKVNSNILVASEYENKYGTYKISTVESLCIHIVWYLEKLLQHRFNLRFCAKLYFVFFVANIYDLYMKNILEYSIKLIYFVMLETLLLFSPLRIFVCVIF